MGFSAMLEIGVQCSAWGLAALSSDLIEAIKDVN